MQDRIRIDLDDTSRCRIRPECEACRLPADDLAAVTAFASIGVTCLTLCPACAAAGRLPVFGSWPEAARRVGEHCEHLGIDLDEMAAALDAGRWAGGAR
ncbi:hypothetical protein ACL02T_12615 [Pseudonocardia sp. RS010]|uniref:hypothetical protein n=1 Tax=Pseudonocardia sp. RS010 TaxID=3385979 RepID=UPI0039A18C2F